VARRPSDARERRFVEPDLSPDATTHDLVRDGMLLAKAGVRMAAKNLIIVRALRDHKDFEQEYYVAAVQQELLALSAEKAADADRVRVASTKAARLGGRPSGRSDYRRDDIPTLRRRIKVLSRLSNALAKASADQDLAHELVSAARESALEEIANAVAPEANTAFARARDRDYREGLEERRAALISDLRGLEKFDG
jgi:hypothetical protein